MNEQTVIIIMENKIVCNSIELYVSLNFTSSYAMKYCNFNVYINELCFNKFLWHLL